VDRKVTIIVNTVHRFEYHFYLINQLPNKENTPFQARNSLLSIQVSEQIAVTVYR